MECSAKSGQSIGDVFMELGRLMKERFIDEGTSKDSSRKEKDKVGLNGQGAVQRRCCESS